MEHTLRATAILVLDHGTHMCVCRVCGREQEHTGSPCGKGMQVRGPALRFWASHIVVGPNLRTGSVCKLRLSVCRLDVFNVQFVDCTPHKSGLQTGIQSANCVNPVCKLGKSSFRGLVCKWDQKKRTFDDDRDRAVYG